VRVTPVMLNSLPATASQEPNWSASLSGRSHQPHRVRLQVLGRLVVDALRSTLVPPRRRSG
jgi:hypothetical protein